MRARGSGRVSAETDDSREQRVSGLEDPRDRDRQVADIVARLCVMRCEGETAASALRAALVESSAPVRDELLGVVVRSCDDGRPWIETSVALHRLARRWRSPILATLADAYSDGGYAVNVDYLNAVAVGTAVEHAVPPALALKRLRHPRQGLRWDQAEDGRLVAAFREGASITELSARHQRNENAIRSRLLLKHGVLEEELAAR
jgi:hypothetical protein